MSLNVFTYSMDDDIECAVKTGDVAVLKVAHKVTCPFKQ